MQPSAWAKRHVGHMLAVSLRRTSTINVICWMLRPEKNITEGKRCNDNKLSIQKTLVQQHEGSRKQVLTLIIFTKDDRCEQWSNRHSAFTILGATSSTREFNKKKNIQKTSCTIQAYDRSRILVLYMRRTSERNHATMIHRWQDGLRNETQFQSAIAG